MKSRTSFVAIIISGAWAGISTGAASAGDLVVSIPNTPKPGYLESYIGPTFGSKVTRITGDPGTAMNFSESGNSGTWDAVARYQYSKVPAWNAGQSLLYLGRNDGFSSAPFLDGNDYTPVFTRNVHVHPGNEMRWNPAKAKADQMIYVNAAEATLGTWNVRTQAKQVIDTFVGYTDLGIGPFEGNISQDGRMIAVNARKNGSPVAFAYEMVPNIKHADIDLSGMTPYDGANTGLDCASASASGNYVVANGRFNTDNRFGGLDQTQIYDLDGSKIGGLWDTYGQPSHYDLTLDENGNDIAAGVSKSSSGDGLVVKRRLDTGEITELTDGGYATPTSTRNIDRPGWAHATYDYEGPSYPPYYGEVMAVKLDGSGTVERIAHLNTLVDSYLDPYLAQSQAVASPDGSRVLWASNRDDRNAPIGAFLSLSMKCLNHQVLHFWRVVVLYSYVDV